MIYYFEIIPYSLLAIWFLFSVYYLIRALRSPNKINPYIFESIPQVFPTIGILGTFIGIAVGLFKFDVTNIESSIPVLLQGLKTAFIASIFGVFLSIVFSKFTALILRKNEKGRLSDETVAINKLIELISEIRNDLNNNLVFTDENGNKVRTANILRDIYQESRKQSQALQSFSTDLSTKIEAGFDALMSNQNQGVIPELQALKTEIENLGKKLQDPATQMTQNVVKELQLALGSMIDEFKISMSGSTKSELERLSLLLSQAGGTLVDFPDKIQRMTDNLNDNFKGLQEVVQQISKQTLIQSEQSTEQMRRQVEEMSVILKNNVGDLQIGQELLITKQSENLTVSDKLLNVFNTSIEKMSSLSVEVSGTISQFNKLQNDLRASTNELKSISENVNRSSGIFQDAQQRFTQHSNLFLETNTKTIQEIQSSLLKAKEVSADFANKFTIIEKGLQGIFSRIQSGLDEYKNTVGESLETFLGKYTDALTSSVESLAGASSKQEDILEELTEQLSQLNGRRS